LILGLFLFLGFAMQTYGLAHTTPSRSAFITALCVVLVPFVSLIVWRQPPSPPAMAGVLLAAVGLAWLTGVMSGTEVSQGAHFFGDALTAVGAVSFAFHITLTGGLAPRHPAPALVTVQLVTVCVLSAACAPFNHPHLTFTWHLGAVLLFCALAATAMGLLLQTWGQSRTTAVRAGLIFALEPVFTAAYVAMLGRERLGVRELGGGALIVLGVVTAEVGGLVFRRRAQLGTAG
jgi:drug/metabolite transporter (DMT)-like permease